MDTKVRLLGTAYLRRPFYLVEIGLFGTTIKLMDSPDQSRHSNYKVLKLIAACAVVIVAVTLYWGFGDRLSLEELAARESDFRELKSASPWIVFGIAFLLYIGVTGLSLPGATILTLTYSWYFGFVPGLLLVSFASTVGATLAFLTSRYLLRDSIQSRFGQRLNTINAAFEREGAFYLFSLRLVPLVPFFLINLLMGLTSIRVSTFWWVSQLGMFPGTAAYVYAGSQLPSLQSLAQQGVRGIISFELATGLAILGILPLVLKKLTDHFRSRPIEEAQ